MNQSKKKKSRPPYLAVQQRGEPLSFWKDWKQECANTHSNTLVYTTYSHPHTHTLTHRHTRSLFHTHNDEEGWLSSERTLQAAACLGKPDAFLPPGRSTHCHLKGSLLGLIHPRLCAGPCTAACSWGHRVTVQRRDKAIKRKGTIQQERISQPHIAPSIPPSFSFSGLLLSLSHTYSYLTLSFSSSSSLSLSLYHFPSSLPPPTPSLGCKRIDSSMCMCLSVYLKQVSNDCKERRDVHLITWDTFQPPLPLLSPFHVMWVM